MSSISSTNPVSNLAAQLFTAADGNSDGRLSATEFQSFLQQLLGNLTTHQTSDLGTESSSVKPLRAADAPRTYQGMLGFDYVKLNTPTHTTPKYVFARATQDVNLPADRASRSAGLQQIVDNVKQNGYTNAKVVGDDTIDFGDGSGEIDVLTGDGQWWWGPKS